MSATLLPDGTTLHRWTNPAGDEWACVAADHGPFCRRCQPVDGTFAVLLDHVLDGNMEIVGTAEDGEFQFRLTPEGERRAEHLVATYRRLEDKDAGR